jgi:hypothetical protein
MSIPLDRLYQYIKTVAESVYQDSVVVYFFYPHGSRDVNNIISAKEPLSESELYLSPEIFCNDQEPLNYELYNNNECIARHSQPSAQVQEILKRKNITFPKFNFRGQVAILWDQALLLHSEKRSVDIEQYQSCQFIPVYYWSHAIIARDWFRYAEYVKQSKQVNQTFLIYNRAWAGTREYRLKFAEHLIRLGLPDNCRTSVNPVEPELDIHYEIHRFNNPAWRPRTVLENFFPISDAHSSYSADFDIEDYAATDIEVVLETLFDDNRLHLTEKSLRPIACGQPFILAGTQGSLEYLRSYGFKTFGMIWDERYDECTDPEERLTKIAHLMQQIANWHPWLREQKMREAQAIAEYNKKHFFSQEFFDLIVDELKTNLTAAFTQLEQTNTSKQYLSRREIFLANPELEPFSRKSKSKEMADILLEKALHYSTKNAG